MSTMLVSQSWPRFTQTWQKMATSVIRPRPSEVLLYESLARLDRATSEPIRVLLLGATPELRSMLSGHENVEVVFVDNCPEMVEAMTALMPTENPRERWLHADWLGAEPGGTFDVVLADMVLSNLPFNDHDRLMGNVRRWLNPGGAFVTRIESIKDVHNNIKLDEFFALFDGCVADDSTVARFWDLAWLTGDLAGRGIDVGAVYDPIARHARVTGHPTVSEILGRGPLFPLDKVWFTYREPDLVRCLRRTFHIDAVCHDPGLDPLIRGFPRIYRLASSPTL